MAPKQDEMIKNPPLASSSEEEEEEESGSSGEESDSSSDEADAQSNLTQKAVVPVAAKKPESDSEEGESESDSDSDSESAENKKKSLDAIVTKQKPEVSVSTVKPPVKRSLKQADDEPKKKIKISATEHVKKPVTADEEVKKISGEEAKKMFQRLFSESDEVAMLQGYLDFTSTKGDPSENMDAFCDYVKTLIDFDASRSQIVTKIQRCKKKFNNLLKNSLKKGITEDKIKCSKDLDQKAFELSRKIWGSNGVLKAKSRNTSKESKSLPSLSSATPKKVKETETSKTSVVNTHLSASREIALFFKAENASVLGLDEATISARWDMVADGPKKRDIEAELKKLKATQMELCLQRTELVDNTAKMIFKDNASS